jgi:hypothetical protein
MLSAVAVLVLYSAGVLLTSVNRMFGIVGVSPARDGNVVGDPVCFCANVILPGALLLCLLCALQPLRIHVNKRSYVTIVVGLLLVLGVHLGFLAWFCRVPLEGHFQLSQLVRWLP